ncbi:MAG: Kdo domain containing protein [Bacteroidia bacterium]|nr:Kdo domain containing protein [Bacteroidia bacterium]
MKTVIHDKYISIKSEVEDIINTFDSAGKPYGDQERNELKLFELDTTTINVKSFKVPNFINQVAYKYFRKSKARRSYEHAVKLVEKEIGTPGPIAFAEAAHPFLFKKSYYLSEHLDYDLTFRELTENLNYPDHDNILRAFTRFTFKLHQNEVEFLDHSPGNTLIKKTADGYEFFLVDLNRMRFRTLNLEERIRNFSRLTPHESVVMTMSDEYAKCMEADKDEVFQMMWRYTKEFQEKYWKKDRWKKRIKFWKNS